MPKVSQLKAGIILSYLSMALSIIIGIVYTPVMLRLLGQNEYGLYNTVASTISMLSVLSLGFNSGYVRYFAKYKKENNEQAIAKLNGLFLIVFTVIGIIAFVCGLFMTCNLRLIFDDGLTTSEYQTAGVLMVLLTINLSVSFPMSVFSNIISANERFIFLKVLGLLKMVGGPLITLPLLLAGYASIAMVSVTVSLSLVVDIIYLIYVRKVLKQRFIFRDFEKGLFKEIFIYTSFIALNLIVDQINTNIDKFLLGRYRGTVAVSVYSIGFALYSYYTSFSTAISGVFTPRIHRMVNETKENPAMQREELTELFVKVGRMQFLVLGLIGSGLVFFGKQFIGFWAGEGYEESYYVLLLLTLPASIALIQNTGIAIQRAQNKHYFRSIVYAVMAILNLLLSIYLCQRYGAVGSALGTAISYIVANGLIMNIYYHKECNINILFFWKQIGRLSLGMLLPIITGTVICRLVEMTSIWLLGVCILAYVAVYGFSMYFCGINEEERAAVRETLRRTFRRKA